MRTFIFFVLAVFITTGAFWGALFSKNLLTGYITAFVVAGIVWSLFAAWVRHRNRKTELRESQERLFRHHMQMQRRR
ncbi:hypothetical protein [Mucilaginibacter paludis]|uniref:Uncharacterized protein n=2 Tax=Mucilaginibacter TaxID=423349 RepID=H1YI64_9SPHI|nr:hypothetical protein [Mucilaginibacter paludis]EHQ26499.1 hypothetical protein Mucpa_2369 [Mucilaginibacter paludis DSM 18603]